MTGTALVTVVLTTYNRPRYLRRAVETVSAQQYRPIELVVVDDCSSPPAADVLEDAAPDVAELRIVRHEENRGANAARNTGVRAATGEYIAFLDDDDRWTPEKLSRQVEAFRADDAVGLVYCGRKLVDDGTVVDVDVPEPIEGDLTKVLLCRNVIGTQSTVMVRAGIARATPFDERVKRWADLTWYVPVSTKCEFKAVREPLVIYERAAHNRISDDYENLLESHRRFVAAYRDLAAEYGWLFERKMRGHASFRVGSASLSGGSYAVARRHFLRAVRLYPLEPRFYTYALATLGGRRTHRTARVVRGMLARVGLPVG